MAEVHVLDAGHFALDTATDQIAQLVRGFMKFLACGGPLAEKVFREFIDREPSH